MRYENEETRMAMPAQAEPDNIPLEELIDQLVSQNQDLVNMIHRRNSLRDRIEEQKSTILKQLDSINRSQFEFENATLNETDTKMNVGMALPKSEVPQWQR